MLRRCFMLPFFDVSLFFRWRHTLPLILDIATIGHVAADTLDITDTAITPPIRRHIRHA